jgi:hypothetical protein
VGTIDGGRGISVDGGQENQSRSTGMQTANGISIFNERRTFWVQHGDAPLNWLALGLLLAAWNAADDDGVHARRRPEELRAHSHVSVRAAQRALQPSPRGIL